VDLSEEFVDAVCHCPVLLCVERRQR
jgi:hypothetical protein